MKINVILSVTLLLIASAARAGAANAGSIPPSITVSDAVGTNPGTVYTAGQTQRTINVAWNVGSDYPYCEIYYTVNNANQAELGRGHDGVKALTVTAGSTYALWMIVYLGAQGQDVRTVAELTVVGNQSNPPSPAPSPPAAARPEKEDTVSLIDDSKRINPDVLSPRSPFELICRGGPGLRFDHNVKVDNPGTFWLDFNRSTQLADGSGYNLQPGQCNGADRALPYELTRFKFDLYVNPPLNALPDDKARPIAEQSPDSDNVPKYLKDPNHYWVFWGVSLVTDRLTRTGYFYASSNRYWKPEFYTGGDVSLVDSKRTGTSNEPPRPICDVAREARARNNAAAPGLEAQCRAVLAAKGAAIAEADSIVAAARAVETDALYRQGFDIATGIFGDPALGALGNTATGPGSLGIRDTLSAAGQRGFNASVKLHLSRNYKP